MQRHLAFARGGHFPGDWIDPISYLANVEVNQARYSANPVLPKGAGWEAYGVRELRPVIDEHGLVVTETDGIWGYYGGRASVAGAWGIGLAKSSDNGTTWVKYGSNPILQATGTSWRANSILQPSVVKQSNGTRVMAAIGMDSSTTDSFGILTSADGLAWSDLGQKLSLASFSDGGAVAELGVPSLVKRSDGTWTVVLECRKSGVTNGWRIFGATATDPTGTWTPMNGGAPLLTTVASTWESVGVANAQLVEVAPGAFVLMYNGMGGESRWRIGFASSTNLTTWTRHPQNPRFDVSTSGSWDDQHTESSFLFKEPHSTGFRFYYQGYSAVDGSMQIGLASRP